MLTKLTNGGYQIRLTGKTIDIPTGEVASAKADYAISDRTEPEEIFVAARLHNVGLLSIFDLCEITSNARAIKDRIIALRSADQFRVAPKGKGVTGRVDRDKKAIYGYSVITAGEARSHDVLVDHTTLEQVVKLGNQPTKGIKVRFTHPGPFDDGMGKYLGRAKNFRVEGSQVIADMHIADSAFDTPHGDLGSYVLNLAEEDPDAFGTSVAIKQRLEQRRDGLMPLLRVEKLYASDVVDDPAANRGLFAANNMRRRMASLSQVATMAPRGGFPAIVIS